MIMSNFGDFMRTVFVIYCIYALNCCLVVFKRPNNPGEIFGRFRIPVLVFIYFLVPCLVLYLVYKAFWGIHTGTFWSGVGLVFPLSFFIMLYFLQDPNWPVGSFLQLQKLPVQLMLILLSLNLAISVVFGSASAYALLSRPAAIEAGPRAQEFRSATENLEKAQDEEKAHESQRRAIQSEATTTVFSKYSEFLKVLFGLITALLTFLTSMLALRKK
jgi:hypothetical protein